MNLMAGASESDWQILCNFDRLRRQVHVYDLHTRSVVPCSAVAWPIVWVLCRYSLKHIFVGNRRLDTDVYAKAVGCWADSVRWRWVFRDHDALRRSSFGVRRPTAKFFGATCPALETWIRKLRGVVMRRVCVASARWRREKIRGNYLPLDRLGMSLLKRSGLFPVKNDKEGGFTLHDRATILQVFEQTLAKTCYAEIDPDRFLRGPLLEKYGKLCTRIVKAEADDDLSRPLRKSLDGNLCSKLMLTCKSTKDPGQVGHRNIHGSWQHAWEGVAAWIEWKLERALKQCPWLVRSAHDFVARLVSQPCCETDVIARIDVSDFFMTGDFDMIRSQALKIVDCKDKAMLSEAIKFVLENQFLQCQAVPNRIWRVCSGSGMGARHSSSLCDAALAGVGEIGFVGSSAANKRFKIRSYYRFRDDIFVHCGCAHLFQEWFDIFQKRVGRLYGLELVSLGKSGDMLSASVELQPPMFSTRPRQKFLGPALCARSAHPSSVRRWPAGHLRSNLALCTSDRIHETVREFIQRFEFYFAPQGTIEFLEEIARDFIAKSGARAPRLPLEIPDDLGPWWIVLPFHPCLDNGGLRQVLRVFSEDPALRADFSEAFRSRRSCPDLRISWSLGSKNLASHIAFVAMRSIQRRLVGEGGGGQSIDRP